MYYVVQNPSSSTSFEVFCARYFQIMVILCDILCILDVLCYLRFYGDMPIVSACGLIRLLKYILERYCTSAVFTYILPSPTFTIMPFTLMHAIDCICILFLCIVNMSRECISVRQCFSHSVMVVDRINELPLFKFIGRIKFLIASLGIGSILAG